MSTPSRSPIVPPCAGFTLGRTLGRDRDHRHPGRALAPGRASARDTARQTQCMNNLKQLGMALIAFETSKQHLPGYVAARQARERHLGHGTLSIPTTIGLKSTIRR